MCVSVLAGFVELPSPNSLANAPPGWIASTREICAEKASELSDLFVAVLREVPNFVSGDIGVATCAYQVSQSRSRQTLVSHLSTSEYSHPDRVGPACEGGRAASPTRSCGGSHRRDAQDRSSNERVVGVRRFHGTHTSLLLLCCPP